MQKTFNGYCTTQNKEYDISVSYVDASTSEGTSYEKGRATCEYVKFGGKCNTSECPIIKSAPTTL